MDRTQRESDDNIRRVAPAVSRAYRLGRQHPDEAFGELRPYLERDEMPAYFCQPVGWAIYRYIKAHLQQLAPQEATTLLSYWLAIAPDRPDMTGSYMMMLAAQLRKLHPDGFSLAAYCRNAGLDLLRDDDYQATIGHTADGQTTTYQPLAAKVATGLYKELKQSRNPEAAREFLPFFEMVARRCTSFEYSALYIANLHAWMGQKDQAIAMLRQQLQRRQQWYLWKHLGELLDTRLRLSCYCKALTLCDDDKYLGDIHLWLALQLEASAPDRAAAEIGVYIATYRSNFWGLSHQAIEAEGRLKAVSPAKDRLQFYLEQSLPAEDFAFADCPQAEFVMQGLVRNRDGKQRARLSCDSRHLTVMVAPTPVLRQAKAGQVLLCRYRRENHRTQLLTTRPTGRTASLPTHGTAGDNHRSQTTSPGRTVSTTPHGADGDNHRNKMPSTGRTVSTTPNGGASQPTRRIEGKVKRKEGQLFAFVGNCFIPPRLCQKASLADGQHVRVKAIRQPDSRWRAEEIEVL